MSLRKYVEVSEAIYHTTIFGYVIKKTKFQPLMFSARIGFEEWRVEFCDEFTFYLNRNVNPMIVDMSDSTIITEPGMLNLYKSSKSC